jgi:hypothetical protein
VITGTYVFTGALATITTAVGADTAVADPPPFAAVTWASMVEPT